MSQSSLLQLKAVPYHVGIIMDGNGRWAKRRGMPRIEGHRQGAKRVRDVVKWAVDAGVRQLSLYAFSTENWDRPGYEVRGLMQLLSMMARSMLPELLEQGVRLRLLGDIDSLPDEAKKAVQTACRKTSACSQIDLILCLSYGGQQEIVAGVRHALRWALQQSDPQTAIDQIDTQAFRKMLWRAETSPVDLIIRTGGEKRISNFHLWDAAYAELCFLDVFWPDFSQSDFVSALHEYAERERRFGLVSEQITS